MPTSRPTASPRRTPRAATDDEPLTSLRDIKAKYAEGSASSEADTSADAESHAESEDEPSDSEEKPKPASSGETHQPRTDAEIGEGGSLFDL